MIKAISSRLSGLAMLLFIRSTIGLAMLLFIRSTIGLLQRLSSPFVLFENDENNHTSLLHRQSNVIEDVDTKKIFLFYMWHQLQWSSVKMEDGGPLMHRTKTGHGSDDQYSRSYKIRVTKFYT